MDNELETYRSRLASDPADLEALRGLEAALLQAKDWQGLVDLTAERAELHPEEAQANWLRLAEGLEAYAEALEDPGQVSQLATTIGHVVDARLGAPEQAIAYFHNAIELDGSNLTALHAARRIHTAAGGWPTVFQLLNLEVAAVDDAQAQANLYFEMAVISRDHLDRPTDTIACVRQALKLVPEHPKAAEFEALMSASRDGRLTEVDALIEKANSSRNPRQKAQLLVNAASLWFDEVPDHPEIETLLRDALAANARDEHARILLEQYYEANDQRDALITWLTERAESTVRKADRQAIYQRLAELNGDDPEAAIAWHREVLGIDAIESTSLNFCVDYYSEREQWHALVEVYEAALRVRHRGRDESAMLVQIAMILWKKIEDLDAAESYFKRIKLSDPKNGLMLTFYREFYRARGDHKRLLQTLTAQQQAAQKPEEKIEIGLQMAQVAEEDLRNLQKAIDVYKSILKIERDHPAARDALRRLFTKTSKWNALLEFLKEDLKLTQGGEARRAIYRQIVEIYRDRMKLSRMVVATWNEVLKESPGDAEALDALEAIYEKRSAWNDLIGILQQRADQAAAADDTDAQVAQLRRIATLWMDKFGNPTRAIDFFEEIVELAPQDAETLGHLIDLYQKRKDWPALFTAFERQLEILDGPERVARLEEMARIADTRLEDAAAAVDLWQQVLTADADNDGARDALEALYSRNHQYEALVALFRERAERTAGAERLPWLRKLARALTDLADIDGAAAAWQSVLDLDPADEEAEGFLRDLYLGRGDWERLERLFGGREKWAEYAVLLEHAADAADNEIARIDLLRRRATVATASLNDEATAVAAWEQVLDAAPDDLEAATTLAPVYEQQARWDGLVRVKEIILAAGPADPVAEMTRLAEVHAEHRADPAKAYTWYVKALKAAPHQGDLLAACERTAAAAGHEDALAVQLEELVAGPHEPAVEVPMRRVLARLSQELGRAAEAAIHYESVVELAGPDDDTLTALRGLYEQLGAWDDLLRVDEQRLARAEDTAQKAAILSGIGQIHETVRDDVDAAAATFEALRALDPDNVEALRGLQRLARRSGDHEQLSVHLRAELDHVDAPADRARLHHQLAELSEEAGDLDAALAGYAEALAADSTNQAAFAALERQLDGPSAIEAATILEPHLRAADAWPALRRVLLIRADALDAPAERAVRLAEIARIEEQQLDDAAAAFATWQRILVDAPADAPARGELERIAQALDAWRVLADHYARFAIGGDLAADADLAADYSRRLAALQDERLREYGAARDTWEVLAADLGDADPVLDAIDRLSQQLQDWKAVAAVCERRLVLAEALEARLPIFFRLAALHEETLADTDAAVHAWQRVLDEAPDHPKAIEALERIFQSNDRFYDLAQLLMSRMEGAEDAARAALAFQLAQILQDQLAAPMDAIDRYAEVLAIDPAHEDASDAIEGLIIEHDEDDGLGLRARACEVLAPIYARRDDWQSSIHIVQVRLGDAADPVRRAELYGQIAALYEEQADDPRAALANYGAALNESFGDPSILEHLERLAASLDAWPEYAAYLRQALEGDGATGMDPVMRREMLARVAQVFVEKVGDHAEAISLNQLILEDDPTDAAALANLDTLYQTAGETDALIEVLARRIDLAPEPADQVALSFRLGALYEQDPARTEQAVAVYSRVRLEIDPAELRAHAALERLYAQQGDAARLVEVLADHADQIDDPATQRTLLIQAAQAHEVGLDQPDRAVDLYRQILEIDADDREALGHLDRLLADLDRPIDLLEVLEKLRSLADEPAARLALDYRLGVLLRDALNEPERAVEHFEAVLAAQADHAPARAALTALLDEPLVRLDAARILAPLYTAEENWAALRDTLRRVLDDRDTVEAQVASLEEIARLEEERLADPAAAFEAYAEAYRRSEGAERLEAQLERLTDALGNDAALADLYESMVDRAGERAEALFLKIARIAETRLSDPQRAVAQLNEVLAREPEHREALDGLERLYTATGEANALIDVLERKAELLDEAADRVAVLARIADLQESLLDDPDGAIATWRRVLGEDEGDATALDNLERLLTGAERWAELSVTLDHRVSVTEDAAARAEVEYRLAVVLERRLGEGQRALDLYRQILEVDGSHDGAREALAALFGDPEGTESLGIPHEVVADILEPIYRQDDDPANLAAVLEVQQRAREGSPVDQVVILTELAELQEKKLRNTDAAFEARGRILQIMPDDGDNRVQLHRLAEQTSRFDALAELLEAAAVDTSDPLLRVALLLSLGQIEERHRGQDGRAIEVYREVINIDPANEMAVEALVEVFTRRAEWDALVQLHLDRAESADDVDLRLELSFEACRILEDVVANNERAIEVYRQVLAFDPTNDRAFSALHRAFSRDNRYDALADLLRERLDVVLDLPARAALRFELGELLENRLNDLDGAIAAWHAVLQDDVPDHEASVDALERLLIELADDPESAPRRERIANILEPIYADAERWSDWILALEVRLEFQSDRWQRMETLSTIARAHEEKLSDQAAAFDAWRRAFAQDFGNADIQVELDRLATELGAWDPLVSAYLAGIDDCDDPDTAIAVLTKSGGLLEQKLARPADAIGVWQRVLDIDESNSAALDALERLLAASDAHAELVEVLGRKAEMVDDPDTRQAIRYRMCDLLEAKLDDPLRAIDTYRMIFEDDPTEGPAIDALVRLYRVAEDWHPLVAMMREQIELSDDDAEKRRILAEIAGVQADHLDDVESTIMTWRSVLEIEPQDNAAQAALEALLRDEGRWGEVIDLFEDQRAAAESDAAQVTAIELKIAAVLHGEMEQTEQAIDLYGEILERDPEAAEARQALESLLESPAHRFSAGRILEPYYEGRNAHAALARIFELQLLDLTGPVERLELLKRLGRLQRDVLSQPKPAFESFAAALGADPADEEVLGALHALADDAGLHPELAQIFEARVAEVSDVPVALDLNRRLARLLQYKLEMPSKAIDAWQAVVQDEPFDLEALAALDVLYTAEENWTALIDVLRRRIDDGTAENLADLQCKLGFLLQNVSGDVYAAIELYRAVLQDQPGHPESLQQMEELAAVLDYRAAVAEVLDPIYRDAQAWDRLALLTEMRIELIEDPRERALMWLQSAEIREEHLGLKTSAFEALLQAFGEVPDDIDVRERLLRLGTEEGLYHQLAVAFTAVQERVDHPDLQIEDQLRIARWQRDELAAPAEAISHFERALMLDPGNEAALDALEALHRERGDMAALADVLQQRIDALFDLDTKRERLLALGRLCESELSDDARAAEAYREALAIDDADTGALDALEALYTRTEDWAALADVLTQRAGVTYDEDALADLHKRLGTIAQDRLGDPARAAGAYERVRELERGDQAVLDALVGLYTELEDWDRLQDALLGSLALNEDDSERSTELLLALARNAEQNQRRPYSAVDYFRQGLTQRPGDAETMAALERLYGEAERWYDLVEAWRLHLDALDGGPETVTLQVKIADVARTQLFDADLAIECLEAALAIEPTHGKALISLAQLHQQAGDWEKAAQSLAQVAEQADADADRASAWQALGELNRDHLDKPAEARAAFEKAVELAELPASIEALLAMARDAGDDATVISLLTRQLDALSGADRLPKLRELATLHQKAGDPTALTLLEEAQRLAPEDLDVVDALLDAWIDGEQFAKAMPLLESTIERLKATRRNRDLFRYNYRLGRVAEAQGDEDGALAAYQACFDIDARYVPNLLRLAALHFRREDWDKALKVYQMILLHQGKLDKDERVDVFYHLGKVRLARGEDRQARNMFNRALSQDPGHAPSKQALDAL